MRRKRRLAIGERLERKITHLSCLIACMRRHIGILAILVALAAANLLACSGAMAQQTVWTGAKSSGEVVVVTGSNGPEAAVSQGMELKPGDALRTGRNGRVLLTRGEEK